MRERADVNAQVAYPTRSQLHEGATRLLPRRSAQKKASAVKPLLRAASGTVASRSVNFKAMREDCGTSIGPWRDKAVEKSSVRSTRLSGGEGAQADAEQHRGHTLQPAKSQSQIG